MLEKRLSRQALVLLVVIGLFFHISETLHLYTEFWWVDVLLHFLAGALVGMTALIFWHHYYHGFALSKLKMIGLGVLFALFVGILWEIFEVHYGITFLSDGMAYIKDTSSDIMMDICGGFFGALYAFHSLKNE